MGVKHKPNTASIMCCLQEELLEFGIEALGPVRFVPNITLIECWNEIQHPVASLFDAVNRVLERFHAIDSRSLVGPT